MASKRKQGYHVHYSTMSAQTKDFLQKICHKETASVDMTRYGFVNDSHPIRLFRKPLRMQLEKIHGQNNHVDCESNSMQSPAKILKFSEKDVTELIDRRSKPKQNVKGKTLRQKIPSNPKKSRP